MHHQFLSIFLFVIIFICSTFSLPSSAEVFASLAKDIRITSLERRVALNKYVVREKLVMNLKNVGNKAIDKIPFQVENMNHLSRIVPNDSSFHLENVFLPQRKDLVSSTFSPSSDNYLTIVLNRPMQKEEVREFILNLVYIDRVSPKPSSIRQSEKQQVVFETNALMPLPYVVESQSVVLELPKQGAILDFSKRVLNQSARKDQNIITYGPFKSDSSSVMQEVSGQKSRIVLHYENNFPFLKIEKLSRLIELSMWGNLAIEEQYVIRHAGAKLEGGFSRFDYQAGNPANTAPASFHSINVTLPYEAKDIYYRDRIGNISTSEVKPRSDKSFTDVIIQPRYPMMGGWKSTFTFGYNVPLTNFLRRSGSLFELKYDFGTPFPEAPIEEYELKILLPEGSSNLQLLLDAKELVPNTIEETRQVVKTYLDTTGRPMLVISKRNVAPELSVRQFKVKFEFSSLSLLHEPLLVIGTFFAICLASMIYIRFNLKIAKTPEQIKNEQRNEAYYLTEQYVTLQNKRDTLYNDLENAFSISRRSGKFDAAEMALKEVTKKRITIAEEVKNMIEILKAYSCESLVTKISLVEQKEQEKMEKIIQLFSLLKKKANEKEFEKIEKVYDSLTEEIASTVESLL